MAATVVCCFRDRERERESREPGHYQSYIIILSIILCKSLDTYLSAFTYTYTCIYRPTREYDGLNAACETCRRPRLSAPGIIHRCSAAYNKCPCVRACPFGMEFQCTPDNNNKFTYVCSAALAWTM